MTLFTADTPYQGHLFKMPFSDYSQRMKQDQIDLVRRFNRAVTQRIGALDDAYLSRGRSLGLSRLLSEIEPAGCELATPMQVKLQQRYVMSHRNLMN
jgi:hypothetical protein